MKYSGLTFFILLLLLNGCTTKSDDQLRQIPSPAQKNSLYPRLFTDNNCTVFMSWMEHEANSITRLKYAVFKENEWSAPIVITADSTWFINWADYPSIIAHNGKPMAVHWLNKVDGGTYAYHINMSVNNNGWSDPFTPHTDDTPTEHGFVSMTPASDSSFLALWLDGRNTMDRAMNEYSNMEKAMSLRAATIAGNGDLLHDYLIDDSVCDCCQTAITKTDIGFAAAYRNRTQNEIRDIFTTTLVNGAWTDPKPVYNDNWHIAACPVNGPAIDALGSTVALAWFTGANDTAVVKMALSKDHGQKYDEPIILDEESALGRVDLNISGSFIWVSWLTAGEKGADLRINSFDLNGERQQAYTLSGLSKDRNSGFPQITPYNGGLLIAYTDVSGTTPKVNTVLLE